MIRRKIGRVCPASYDCLPPVPNGGPIELFLRAQTGDKQAFNTIIRLNILLVFKRVEYWVRKWEGAERHYEDLVAEGADGLQHAVRRYNAKRGAFSTCAYVWIDQRVRVWLQRYIPLLHVSVDYRGPAPCVVYCGVGATAAMKFMEDNIEGMRRDTLTAYPVEDEDKQSTILRAMRAALTQEEYTLLTRRFGLPRGTRAHLLKEFAAELKVSKATAGVRVHRVLNKLRHSAQFTEAVSDYLE